LENLLTSVSVRQKNGPFFLYFTLLEYDGDVRWGTKSVQLYIVALSKLVSCGEGGDRMKLVLILVILILGSAAAQLDCTEQESKFYLEKKLQRQ
jgi:hypothetical protein